MKLWVVLSVVLTILAVNAFGGESEREGKAAPLTKYSTGDFEFEAGFVPDKTEYVWGEPIHYFTYIIRNTGNMTLSFEEGGDYRGGRSEGHKITAIDANGETVTAPEMHRMGGFMGIVKLEPGQVYTKMLPVSRRLTFTGPGEYTVTGQRILKIGDSLEKPREVEVITSNSFDMTIFPYSDERMAKVVKELTDEIWAAGNVTPRDIEVTEPTEITQANRLSLAWLSLTEIKHKDVLPALIKMSQEGSLELRKASLVRLGKFKGEGQLLSYTTLLEELNGADASIRSAAAEGLGFMSTAAAIDALIEALPKAEPQVAGNILRALGRTQSQCAFDILAEYINHKNTIYRYGTVDGLSRFSGMEAVTALKERASDEEDMDLREYIVRILAEMLRQPIDPYLLIPVIKSRNGTHTIGDAPRLMRLYGGAKSVPVLLECLDFENPSIRNYYNGTIIDQQGWCIGGLKIPWNMDLNRDGTKEEIEKNKKTLKTIQAWINHYNQYRLDEKEIEKWPDWWGEPVDGISVRVRLNQRVWPEGMPQLIMFDIRNHPGGGTRNISNVPESLEVEFNGDWYIRQPPLKEATVGIDSGHGSSFQNLQLDDNWCRKHDGCSLKLKPGEHTLRLGISTTPAISRTGLAISKPVTLEIIKVD